MRMLSEEQGEEDHNDKGGKNGLEANLVVWEGRKEIGGGKGIRSKTRRNKDRSLFSFMWKTGIKKGVSMVELKQTLCGTKGGATSSLKHEKGGRTEEKKKKSPI